MVNLQDPSTTYAIQDSGSDTICKHGAGMRDDDDDDGDSGEGPNMTEVWGGWPPISPSIMYPPFSIWGIMDIRSVFSPDVVTTADNNNNSGSPFLWHPAPSIDCTSTIEPLPLFPIPGNPMVTVISPHELPMTLYGPVDPYLTP
ncbi:hypothetical protein ARMSODRAFT_1027242 [Armillaria solidipes]|uniref:Uncharacterized protein n=1 Tax=Armillaria solidipes TaxID=1076256 RepID=A0A2H3AL68_9AGAR|nr:hypothetical protein ARMSODRAFT_1027242 [Armillaria solidipes]